MFKKLTEKFKGNPRVYYALSIGATWAGAGSLMNATTLAQTVGVIPALIWCICNTLACVVFGLVIWKLPTVQEVMRMKVCRIVLVFFSAFQMWLAMTALPEAWATTPLGETGGRVMAYAVAIAFTIIIYKMGIISNVLTDNGGMYLIYALVIVLCVVSFAMSGFDVGRLSMGLEAEDMREGIYKGLLLLPGPFTYPYFYKLIDYNDENGDGTKQIDIKMAFIYGGIGFGIYLAFAFLLIFTEVNPVLNVIKAVLLSALAISTLSSFIYSNYGLFGKKVGLATNIFAIAAWALVAPLGVMGVWTLMSETRIYLVLAMLLVALGLKIKRSREAKPRASIR